MYKNRNRQTEKPIWRFLWLAVTDSEKKGKESFADLPPAVKSNGYDSQKDYRAQEHGKAEYWQKNHFSTFFTKCSKVHDASYFNENGYKITYISYNYNMRHHAFVIEAEAEAGIGVAQAWAKENLGMKAKANPDFVTLRFGLFSVEDARRVTELASSAPFVGEHKVVIITASRAYHEAQNALLKIFEEPPVGVYLFFVLPSLGGLLPTLRSRVQVLNPYLDVRRPTSDVGRLTSHTLGGIAEEFIKASKEKRSAMIKKLTSGKDEEEKREFREEAIAIVNGIETVAYMSGRGTSRHRELLEDIQVLRGYLHDRSAPVKMILEHLSLVLTDARGKL